MDLSAAPDDPGRFFTVGTDETLICNNSLDATDVTACDKTFDQHSSLRPSLSHSELVRFLVGRARQRAGLLSASSVKSSGDPLLASSDFSAQIGQRCSDVSENRQPSQADKHRLQKLLDSYNLSCSDLHMLSRDLEATVCDNKLDENLSMLIGSQEEHARSRCSLLCMNEILDCLASFAVDPESQTDSDAICSAGIVDQSALESSLPVDQSGIGGIKNEGCAAHNSRAHCERRNLRSSKGSPHSHTDQMIGDAAVSAVDLKRCSTSELQLSNNTSSLNDDPAIMDTLLMPPPPCPSGLNTSRSSRPTRSSRRKNNKQSSSKSQSHLTDERTEHDASSVMCSELASQCTLTSDDVNSVSLNSKTCSDDVDVSSTTSDESSNHSDVENQHCSNSSRYRLRHTRRRQQRNLISVGTRQAAKTSSASSPLLSHQTQSIQHIPRSDASCSAEDEHSSFNEVSSSNESLTTSDDNIDPQRRPTRRKLRSKRPLPEPNSSSFFNGKQPTHGSHSEVSSSDVRGSFCDSSSQVERFVGSFDKQRTGDSELMPPPTLPPPISKRISNGSSGVSTRSRAKGRQLTNKGNVSSERYDESKFSEQSLSADSLPSQTRLRSSILAGNIQNNLPLHSDVPCRPLADSNTEPSGVSSLLNSTVISGGCAKPDFGRISSTIPIGDLSIIPSANITRFEDENMFSLEGLKQYLQGCLDSVSNDVQVNCFNSSSKLTLHSFAVELNATPLDDENDSNHSLLLRVKDFVESSNLSVDQLLALSDELDETNNLTRGGKKRLSVPVNQQYLKKLGVRGEETLKRELFRYMCSMSVNMEDDSMHSISESPCDSDNGGFVSAPSLTSKVIELPGVSQDRDDALASHGTKDLVPCNQSSCQNEQGILHLQKNTSSSEGFVLNTVTNDTACNSGTQRRSSEQIIGHDYPENDPDLVESSVEVRLSALEISDDNPELVRARSENSRCLSQLKTPARAFHVRSKAYSQLIASSANEEVPGETEHQPCNIQEVSMSPRDRHQTASKNRRPGWKLSRSMGNAPQSSAELESSNRDAQARNKIRSDSNSEYASKTPKISSASHHEPKVDNCLGPFDYSSGDSMYDNIHVRSRINRFTKTKCSNHREGTHNMDVDSVEASERGIHSGNREHIPSAGADGSVKQVSQRSFTSFGAGTPGTQFHCSLRPVQTQCTIISSEICPVFDGPSSQDAGTILCRASVSQAAQNSSSISLQRQDMRSSRSKKNAAPDLSADRDSLCDEEANDSPRNVALNGGTRVSPLITHKHPESDHVSEERRRISILAGDAAMFDRDSILSDIHDPQQMSFRVLSSTVVQDRAPINANSSTVLNASRKSAETDNSNTEKPSTSSQNFIGNDQELPSNSGYERSLIPPVNRHCRSDNPLIEAVSACLVGNKQTSGVDDSSTLSDCIVNVIDQTSCAKPMYGHSVHGIRRNGSSEESLSPSCHVNCDNIDNDDEERSVIDCSQSSAGSAGHASSPSNQNDLCELSCEDEVADNACSVHGEFGACSCPSTTPDLQDASCVMRDDSFTAGSQWTRMFHLSARRPTNFSMGLDGSVTSELPRFSVVNSFQPSTMAGTEQAPPSSSVVRSRTPPHNEAQTDSESDAECSTNVSRENSFSPCRKDSHSSPTKQIHIDDNDSEAHISSDQVPKHSAADNGTSEVDMDDPDDLQADDISQLLLESAAVVGQGKATRKQRPRMTTEMQQVCRLRKVFGSSATDVKSWFKAAAAPLKCSSAALAECVLCMDNLSETLWSGLTEMCGNNSEVLNSIDMVSTAKYLGLATSTAQLARAIETHMDFSQQNTLLVELMTRRARNKASVSSESN